jgi:hypothetical protein
MVKKRLILSVLLMLQIVPLAYASGPTAAIYFTNTYGYDRDYYFVYDTIYVTGHNFDPDTNYTVALVKDITLTNGMVIPESAPDTVTMITSDSDGNVSIAEIWSQFGNTGSPYLPIGDYYLFVDVDDDGIYDEEVDVVGSTSIKPSVGLTRGGGSDVPQFVTPEFPGGTIMAVVAFLIAALLFSARVRRERFGP